MAKKAKKTTTKGKGKMTEAEKKQKQQAKADKFVELANNRVTKAIVAIRSVGKLANRASYAYTDKQVDKITGALNTELDNALDNFATGEAVSESGFDLNDE